MALPLTRQRLCFWTPARDIAPCNPTHGLTLYKRSTLLALNVIYGYGYRAVSSVLYTAYCEIARGGTPPACAQRYIRVWLPGWFFRFHRGKLRNWLRGHRATLPLVTSLTLYKRHDLLSLDGTYGVWLPGGIFRFVHGILRNHLRRYSACRERRPRRSAIFFRSCRESGGLPPAACMRLSC